METVLVDKVQGSLCPILQSHCPDIGLSLSLSLWYALTLENMYILRICKRLGLSTHGDYYFLLLGCDIRPNNPSPTTFLKRARPAQQSGLTLKTMTMTDADRAGRT